MPFPGSTSRAGHYGNIEFRRGVKIVQLSHFERGKEVLELRGDSIASPELPMSSVGDVANGILQTRVIPEHVLEITAIDSGHCRSSTAQKHFSPESAMSSHLYGTHEVFRKPRPARMVCIRCCRA